MLDAERVIADMILQNPNAFHELGLRHMERKPIEADFQVWRNHQAWTAGKYRRFDHGEHMLNDWRAIGAPV